MHNDVISLTKELVAIPSETKESNAAVSDVLQSGWRRTILSPNASLISTQMGWKRSIWLPNWARAAVA